MGMIGNQAAFCEAFFTGLKRAYPEIWLNLP